MEKKINVGVLFGGKSVEHEVSLQSARNVVEALDREKYNVILIGIDKHGKWHLYEEFDYLIHPDDPKAIELARISHQTLGKLETSVSPLHPRISLGKVYKPSLRKLLGASKKQSAQSSSRAGEKCGLELGIDLFL